MMIVKANKDSEAGVMPSEELISAMTKYNEELVKAGVLLDLHQGELVLDDFAPSEAVDEARKLETKLQKSK